MDLLGHVNVLNTNFLCIFGTSYLFVHTYVHSCFSAIVLRRQTNRIGLPFSYLLRARVLKESANARGKEPRVHLAWYRQHVSWRCNTKTGFTARTPSANCRLGLQIDLICVAKQIRKRLTGGNLESRSLEDFIGSYSHRELSAPWLSDYELSVTTRTVFVCA